MFGGANHFSAFAMNFFLIKISTFNLVYKLIANIIAHRLKHIIKKVISEEQFSFLFNIYILDAVLLVHE